MCGNEDSGTSIKIIYNNFDFIDKFDFRLFGKDTLPEKRIPKWTKSANEYKELIPLQH